MGVFTELSIILESTSSDHKAATMALRTGSFNVPTASLLTVLSLEIASSCFPGPFAALSMSSTSTSEHLATLLIILEKLYALNAVCDLTGFVLVNATHNIAAHDLARLFVQGVLLKNGLCGLVVVDDGSTLKGLFHIGVYDILNIDIHVTVPGNHKAVAVEYFHRCLNKAVTIGAKDRGTDVVFVEQAAHTVDGCGSPIDGTGIIKSVPAVGRPFRSPFDLSPRPALAPAPTSNQCSNVHAFLCFASPVLSLLSKSFDY